jgi:hypothetical protein
MLLLLYNVIVADSDKEAAMISHFFQEIILGDTN